LSRFGLSTSSTPPGFHRRPDETLEPNPPEDRTVIPTRYNRKPVI
jgi:hypothetical protein